MTNLNHSIDPNDPGAVDGEQKTNNDTDPNYGRTDRNKNGSTGNYPCLFRGKVKRAPLYAIPNEEEVEFCCVVQ